MFKTDEREERNSRYRPLEHVLRDKEISFLGISVIAQHLSMRKSLDGKCPVSRQYVQQEYPWKSLY